ncbi:MAG: 6-phosphofructokinase [Eubacterium sp.]|nr:6-phosphofructokinase [Eubacterium sp.]MDD7210253.1 6-phosphofructokinase [Lachnospiraceae bacterium]MDY5497828.1 6-phosphofructokinase [Anaerobutyricum sp.]
MKGNVIVGQSGGPTAVINASLAGIIKASRKAKIPKIYGMHYGIEGFLNEDLIDLDDYITCDSDLSLLKRTPASFLGSCRYKLPSADENEAIYEKIFAILEKYNIEYFLYIGGNDSMDTIQSLSDYAIANGKTQKFMGVPKTIDNDLPLTDHTPGYGSAAKYIATSMKEIIRDNESFGASKPTICIVEIMGRHAGWLTAASVLSKDVDCSGPDLIYLPEIPFDVDQFLEKVKELAAVKRSVVIAVSEGLRLADGRFVCELSQTSEYVDAFGHRQLSGCASYLAGKVTSTTGLKSRPIEFSTLQRCATHMASRVDVDEAYEVGFIAAKAAFEGNTGMMVIIEVSEREPYLTNYNMYDIHEIANVERKVPLHWITRNGTYVSDEFVEYASPLIIGTILPYYAGGLPKHLTLKRYDHK